MSLSQREDYKKKLTEIKAEVTAKDNPLHLDSDAQERVLVVTNALLIVLDYMDDERLLNSMSLFEADGKLEKSPLHLEEHIQGKQRENTLYSTLYGPFITYFDYFKELGNNHLQVFCSKMRGYCIEDRTRQPFNYGQSVMFGLDLAEIAEQEENYHRTKPDANLYEEWDLLSDDNSEQKTVSDEKKPASTHNKPLPPAVAMPYYLFNHIPDFTEEDLLFNFNYKPPVKTQETRQDSPMNVPESREDTHLRICQSPAFDIYIGNKTNRQIHNLLKRHGMFAGFNDALKERKNSYHMVIHSESRKEYRDYVKNLATYHQISPETWAEYHSPKLK